MKSSGVLFCLKDIECIITWEKYSSKSSKNEQMKLKHFHMKKCQTDSTIAKTAAKYFSFDNQLIVSAL